jgi:hypothetical protein
MLLQQLRRLTRHDDIGVEVVVLDARLFGTECGLQLVADEEGDHGRPAGAEVDLNVEAIFRENASSFSDVELAQRRIDAGADHHRGAGLRRGRQQRCQQQQRAQKVTFQHGSSIGQVTGE